MANDRRSTSFWRFFIRVMVQFIFLTPKPPMLPQAPPGNKPYIGAILGSNAICIILHAYQHAPSAGEATRGYMHGGLAMDFIGQKGPSSKIHLLLLDLFVVFLQLTQLSVLLTVHKLKESSSTSRASTTRPAATRQDLDSEERGVRRSIEQQDIEMQNLNSSGTTTTPPQETDHPTDPDLSGREALLATTTPGRRTDANIFDAFNSGQIVVADLDIPNTVREQFWLYRAESLADAGDARTMRANITGQLLRWRSGGLAGRNVQTV